MCILDIFQNIKHNEYILLSNQDFKVLFSLTANLVVDKNLVVTEE